MPHENVKKFVGSKILFSCACVVVFLANAGTLHAEIVLAAGVEAKVAGNLADSGWYDVNKNCWSVNWGEGGASNETRLEALSHTNDDLYMCWAGTASNMLQWGLDRIASAEFPSPIKPGTPVGFDSNRYYQTRAQTNIYKTFCENWTDKPYYIADGLMWWMNGMTIAHEEEGGSELRPDASGGAYWATPVGNFDFFVKSEDTYFKDKTGYGKTNFAELVRDIFAPGDDVLRGSVAGLAIYTLDAEGVPDSGHAITCWGYELDENGFVSKLFISDTDDGPKNTSVHDSGEMDEYDAETLGFVLRDIEVFYSGDAGKELICFDDLYDDAKFILGEITRFNPFGLLSVPEPSLFGLLSGVFALVLAGTRRRRKSSNTK